MARSPLGSMGAAGPAGAACETIAAASSALTRKREPSTVVLVLQSEKRQAANQCEKMEIR
jgi:hypothetical protein